MKNARDSYLPQLFANTSQHKILYHYTDINALANIFREDGIYLRASSCLYLNDKKEITEGKESVSALFERDITDNLCFRDYYITSFCTEKDSLPMWGMYSSNGEGVSIGIDSTELEKAFSQGLLSCCYGQDALRDQLEQLKQFSTHLSANPNDSRSVKEQQDDLLWGMCVLHCLSAKNEAYKHEHEIRGIVRNPPEGRDAKYKHMFRVHKGIIVPFIEIKLPKTALRKIVFGPTTDSGLTRQSIEDLLSLRSYGYGNGYVILSSTCPYRG